MESIDIRLENDVVRLTEDQAVYRDQLIQNDRYKPVAFPAEHCLYCVDGKLHYDYNGKCFDMDTNTMQRMQKPGPVSYLYFHREVITSLYARSCTILGRT